MILALSATGPSTKVWLVAPEATEPGAPVLEWESGRHLADELLTRIMQILEGHHLTAPDLTGFVLESGPGSFTSLRIGHSTINGLAAGLNVPVVGAQGEGWLAQSLAEIKSAKSGVPALPFYGSEAHITQRKS